MFINNGKIRFFKGKQGSEMQQEGEKYCLIDG